MGNRRNGLGLRALAVQQNEFKLDAFRWLMAVVSVSISLIVPGRCAAQTLDLNLPGANPPDNGSYGIFQNGGQFASYESVINGYIGLGNNAGLTVDSGPKGSTFAGTYSVSPLSVTLPNARSANTFTPGNEDLNFSSLPLTFTGNSGVNLFNMTGDFNISNNTINLSGASTDTFIFYVNNGGEGLNFSGVTMNLSGVLASNVIFDIVGGGAVNISNSTISGTYYTDSGSIEVNDASVVTGALVSGGGGYLSIDQSTVNAEPFAAADLPVVTAPEMPTIFPAGLGAIALLARSYFHYLRQKRSSSSRVPAA